MPFTGRVSDVGCRTARQSGHCARVRRRSLHCARRVEPSLLAILEYLGTINLLLALFNLVPAFPLDGGRMLRAGIWHWRRDLRGATRIASAIGSAFAFILIALGVFRVLAGDFITGMWWVLIGLFLRAATAAAYRRVLLRDALAGEAVRRFMNTNLVSVPADASLSELVDDYLYRPHHTFYPVVENGRLSGCITTRQVKDVPRAEWGTRTVGAAAMHCSPDATVPPDADAVDALARMQRFSAPSPPASSRRGPRGTSPRRTP